MGRGYWVYCLISALIVLFGFFASYASGAESLRDFVFYFGSAVMQSYATLIAIPFTIAIVHLQSRYGFVAIDFLFRYSLRVFIVFGAIILAVFSAMTIANTEIYGQNSILRGLFLIMLVAIALLPLPFIINYIKSLFTLKPIDIVDFLLRDKRINEELRAGKYNRLREVLSKVFLLAGLCISDPSLELELGKVITRINKFFYSTIIPYMKESIDIDLSNNFKGLPEDNLDLIDLINKELVNPILGYFNKYIVEYLKYSKIQKPLIDPKVLFPLIDAVNDIVRISIEKEIIVTDQEYCYFIDALRKIMSVYIEDGRIDSALSIFEQVYLRSLESKDDILDLKHIQEIILEYPREYWDPLENSLLPSTYDIYIDYTAAVLCMTLKLLLQKLVRGIENLASYIKKFIWDATLMYPIILYGIRWINCKFNNNCAHTIVKLIAEQKKAQELRHLELLNLLIVWLIEAYIVAENLLIKPDKERMINSIMSLLCAMEEIGIVPIYPDDLFWDYIVVCSPDRIELLYFEESISLSEIINNIIAKHGALADIISKYSIVEICKIIHDKLGFRTKDYNLNENSDKE